MPERVRTLLPFLLLILSGFFTGYTFAAVQQEPTSAMEDMSSLPMDDEIDLQAAMEDMGAAEKGMDIMVVFTVDEGNRIHVLDITGGHNMLTDYIRRSLEGRILRSSTAIPGINYVMTLRFPSSV